MNKRSPSFYFTLILIVLFVFFFLYWLFVWRNQAYTNDAYVQGNQVYIKALRPGFVTGIYTDDSFLVKKGQLIVSLNETDSLIALEKAKKKLAKTVRDVCQAFHDVFILAAEIEVKKAELLKAQQNLKHRHDVIHVKGISLEDYQHAQDDLKATAASLKSTKNNYQKMLAFVQGTSIIEHPWVQAAAQEVRDAWVQLYRCKIYAPVDGLVAQRTIQVGMWVSPNEPLMSIIPLDQMWVNANFKETQLKKMRIGQKVTFTSDLYGANVVYHGRIVGLPGGAGNAFSLLPPENLSGNWIKIVQRLPVRIALIQDELKKFPLRIGLSLEVTANLSDQNGPLVPTTTSGAPHYITDIFQKEEAGDKNLIAEIIRTNLDPNLQKYANTPLTVRNTILNG
ncbi:HlyD family efflux transporter periplasmic adaptor subunit [Fluoribacter dumoffii]|uniref:HlyD family efflux transporter periplasmic adaptor subunit n=1 Tax=Fluoribacter dumoffii TaxID=463 RepID=UPI00224491C9|nr:HlyD family efflux transporter periplasmic adaptor subunit [Fluoribacter dumoffii]MCW8418378.1 HlyD family efflux transporter periplasmic adaptor subunit [Fluoribacter dumoffii]MCW8453780.1 HlyD family efflux transporter periplasmic adaptor subunit [Fluoribacter dumoffii]MCW8462149.1 HlyD family efflux transporter periplasmic adaptor subunit [Fluoribacter dumoffii]MCW8482361.1 HlyD family efflux transporter periplasmic adaptor subunit [Fluoribacter dumoffii]